MQRHEKDKMPNFLLKLFCGNFICRWCILTGEIPYTTVGSHGQFTTLHKMAEATILDMTMSLSPHT